MQKLRKAMESWYVITVKGILGPEGGKELCILNRKISVEGEYVVYAPDVKHAQAIVSEMGLKSDSKGLDAPVKKDGRGGDDADGGESTEPMDREEASRFRGLVARANYLAQGRLELQFV